VCPPPRTKGGGVYSRRAVRGWGVNILEDARHCSVLSICKYFVLYIQRESKRSYLQVLFSKMVVLCRLTSASLKEKKIFLIHKEIQMGSEGYQLQSHI
jgi:hypothetical protein